MFRYVVFRVRFRSVRLEALKSIEDLSGQNMKNNSLLATWRK